MTNEEAIKEAWQRAGHLWPRGPKRFKVPVRRFVPPTPLKHALTGDPSAVVDDIVEFEIERGSYNGEPAQRVVGRFRGAELVVSGPYARENKSR